MNASVDYRDDPPRMIGVGVLHTPEGRRAAAAAIALARTAGRGKVRKAGYPSDDQATTIAVKLLDVGVEIEDERDVILGISLLRSKLRLDEIEAAATR